MANLWQAARASRSSSVALAAVGVLWGGWAGYIPDIKARVGAADDVFGLALMMAAAGSMVSMQLAPRVMAWAGRAILPVSGALAALAALAPLGAASAFGIGAALFAMGAAIAMLDISANIRLSVEEEARGLHLMNFAHSAFSFAFGGTALAASFARQAGWPPEVFLPLMALTILTLAAATYEGTGWRAVPEVPEGASAAAPWRAILPVAAIMFLSFICENATDNWSALHIERTLGAVAGYGAYGPAILGLTMGIGRLGGQVASARLGEAGLIGWSAVLGVVGAAVTALAPTPAIGILGVALLGFGVAVTVPSANTILGRLVRPDQRGIAISRAWVFGFLGFFLGPTLMGQISEAYGLRWSFGAVALLMAAILPFLARVAILERASPKLRRQA